MATIPSPGAAGMPAPGSRKAPEFNGKRPEKIDGFFERFEELAKSCGLKNEDMGRLLVRYVDEDTKELWTLLPGYDQDYGLLKKKILETYSRAVREKRHTVEELAEFVKEMAEGDIDDEDDLNRYFRKFWPIATYLVNADKITKYERDRYFWWGLPLEARKAIRFRLETIDHKFDRTQIPEIDKVMEVGRFVYAKEATDGSEARGLLQHKSKKKGRKESQGRKRRGRKYRDSSSDSEDSDESSSSSDESEDESSDDEGRGRKGRKSRKSGKKEVRTRRVKMGDEGKKKEPEKAKVLDEVAELTRKLDRLDVKDTEYLSTYAQLVLVAPTIAEKLQPPARWVTTTPIATSMPAQAFMPPPLPPRQQTALPPMARGRRGQDWTCMFCKDPNHRIRDCSLVPEYV